MNKLYMLICLIVMAVGFSSCIALATGGHSPHAKNTEKHSSH